MVAKLIHQYAEYAMKDKHDLSEVGLGGLGQEVIEGAAKGMVGA